MRGARSLTGGPAQPLRLRALADVLIWVLLAPLAFWLRLPSSLNVEAVLAYTLFGVFIKGAAASFTGYFRHLHLYLDAQGLWAIVRTVLMGELLMLAAAVWLRDRGVGPLPFSVPVIEGALLLVVLFGTRLFQRAQQEAPAHLSRAAQGGQRTLIYGAGEGGFLIAREMLQDPKRTFEPLAFLDDAPGTWQQLILGLPILGSLERLEEAARSLGVSHLIIAMPSAPGEAIRRVHNRARELGLTVQTMPPLAELLHHRPQMIQLRDVKLDDLLRRAPVQLNTEAIGAYLQGQTVLVTGAGGSIGSEIVRQVAQYRPRQLILFGRGENSIFAIQQELLERAPEVCQIAIIGDIRHSVHLERVFGRFAPQVVFHAAAHKHVPLMEDSPSEAVYNNVIGTRIVTELCLRFGVRRFVNISSDKAVNPSSVMGASKRIAEMVISEAASRVQPGQAFMSVRFGNVLGSRGSVIPTFLRQIAAGGPVTVTDERMTRYFMTIPEATRLVLQAGALAGNGSVYLLNMGEPMRIVDLARDLIRLAGREVEIRITGIRPGEKLYEELLTRREHVDATSHSDIFTARLEQPDPQWLHAELERLERHARAEDYQQVRQQLRRMIPESQVRV